MTSPIVDTRVNLMLQDCAAAAAPLWSGSAPVDRALLRK